MISVVIPLYNEEKALPKTLKTLFRQPGDYEVLVVDGGSTDRTRAIVESFGFTACAIDHLTLNIEHCQSSPSPLTARLPSSRARFGRAQRRGQPEGSSPKSPYPTRVFLTAPKGRASQMNAGAKAARGEWLLFLHADTLLPPGAIQRLNEMEANEAVQAGGFMHQFSGNDWRLRFISFLDNFRCTRSRIIYGDQALFVRRSLFERLGGFPDQPMLEDVAFCERLIKVTNPLLLSPPVITDARKFVKMGVWRSFFQVLLIILHVEYGLPVLPRGFFLPVR